MRYQFSTNSRIIEDIFAKYKNTFLAFCELINNSIQANATKIFIDIDQTAEELLSKPITKQIKIKDDGVGVSKTDIKKKIFEIGTDVKPKGKGIGRFAAFQIGSFMEVKTVAYDHKLKNNVKTTFSIKSEDLTNNNLEKINFDAKHKTIEGEQDTYYEVRVNNIYKEADIKQERHKKIHKNLYLSNINEAIFLQYPIQILNNEVSFVINGTKINKEDFVIGNIDKRDEVYVDINGASYPMSLTFINYKASSKDIQVFLRVDNNQVRTVAYKFKYSCDIPDPNGWLVYIDSKLFDENQDVFRNLPLSRIREDSSHLIENIQNYIDKFFNEKFKEYFSFSKILKDDQYYPYRQQKASSTSKSIVFNQLAYFIDKEHKILSEKNKIRKIIFPLVDKAISHGELTPVINGIISLKGKHIKKFNELLQRTNLEEVIQFSENVAKKNQFLDFIDNIIYGAAAKHIKERSQLHKIIEKSLWIFGEQYNDTPVLFSDKSLKNNLLELRKRYFDYELSKDDDNLQEIGNKKLRDITDLFFFNEKAMDDQRREVMVIELKRPSCKIGQKELSQVDKYSFNIEDSGKFSQDIIYKIILISSDLSKYARSKVGTFDPKNPYLYTRNKTGNIEVWAIKWSDLIHANRKKLSYLGNAMHTKDQDVKTVFERDYKDIEISNLVSVMTCAT